MPSLTDAIATKYSSDNFRYNGPEDGSYVIFVPKSAPLPTTTGEGSCTPTVLVLNNFSIDSAGDLQKLENICTKVNELDLSHNQLSSWDEVFKILTHIPALEFINLSHNNLTTDFSSVSSLSLSGNGAVPPLKTLVLIGTCVTWNSVWSLLSRFENLKELHLSLNKLMEVNFPLGDKQQFPNIEKLMFDGNPVSDWSQIEKLGQIFPSLKYLSVSNCPLRLLLETGNSSEFLVEETNFPNLEGLNLTSTLIETEQEILRLNSFQKLMQVRITGIPFLERVEAKQKRQELIALLPKIQKLNGGADISLEERDGAERYYIRKFLNAAEKPSTQRYSDLVQKHGELCPLVDINLKPVTKVSLKIKFGQAEEVEQEVNLRQSVKEFKKSLEPIVGLPSSRMTLYYLDVGMSDGRDILRFPDKQLYTYNMRHGDEIHVEIKNNRGKDTSKS